MRNKVHLRRRCERIIERIPLPQPFDVDALRLALAKHRARPLNFHALPQPTTPGLPSGMWLATDQEDHIFYDGQTSPLHQRHIIFHEIGHILFDHNDRILLDNAVLHSSANSLDPDIVKRFSSRTCYSTREEQEAEMTATLLLEKVGSHSTSSPSNGVLANLERALGYRGRR
ncbi:hypothetical protein GCM10022225_26470 [Plantactinospora mayteni]|uniref:IrrE N-terminal-like domain-containing protein n=1 Tax=Plantactinospora mayteni TaxID=566021 RepID=A0ABQ4EIR9_9ACTN|nr:ImmA/IrrE family metallo-endopeptidase [Plantactinospora mayteni]GIG94623.1 hypothetical protein Pma05_11960 [Plantactinospora mayteni]